MNALIVSLGSIGRRHLTNLRGLRPRARICVWHLHTRPVVGAPAPGDEGADAIVYSLEDALAARPDVALVCSPAPTHVEVGRALGEHGVHLLIEKPLSDALDGVDGLLAACRARGAVLMVGYPLRFDAALQAVHATVDAGRIGRPLLVQATASQYLPDWRPGTDYRRGVSARQELGGGVLLELSHEFDYVRWLLGEVVSVSAQAGQVSDLEVDVEDTADVHLRFANGAHGNVHLDMVQRAPVRTCRIAGTEGTVEWDGIAGSARWYDATAGAWEELCGRDQDGRNDMYQRELEHFLRCVEGEAVPAVDGEDAKRSLEVVLAAREAARDSRTVAL